MQTQICEKFCRFHRPGKEDAKCGSYAFLERNLSPGEIRQAVGSAPVEYDFSEDKAIRAMVCEKCGFLSDDCDFRQGLDSPPCGGYTVMEHLLKGGLGLILPPEPRSGLSAAGTASRPR